MKRIKIVFTLIAVSVFIILFFIFIRCSSSWCLLTKNQKIKLVNSFENCVDLGFPVMESYPRQCKAGVKLFIEKVLVENNNLGLFEGNDKIKIFTPLSNTIISSPLAVKGEARGNWYFEASFPIKILDGNGNQIAVSVAQAKENWMTTDFVPFEIDISFKTPKTATGTLVLEKDNPSGLPEYDDYFIIPILFK